MSSSDRLVFVHIPKCAGTSIDTSIRKVCQLPLDGQVVPRAARIAANRYLGSLSPQQFFVEYPRLQEYLLHYFIAAEHPMISGHLPVTTAILERYSKNLHFVTVLRDPATRWISHYVYNKLTSTDPQVPPSADFPGDPQDELQGVLSSWRGLQLGHMCTTMLCGDAPIATRTADAVASAKKNLQMFHVVGVLEELDIWIEQFANVTGHRLVLSQLNRTKDCAPRERFECIMQMFDVNVRRKISELCAADYDVYYEARSIARARS